MSKLQGQSLQILYEIWHIYQVSSQRTGTRKMGLEGLNGDFHLDHFLERLL